MATEVANNSSVAIAMAIVGRNKRACDVCANKCAHWFCAADDAYLCKGCDTQVHSANALSLRHERVRLSATGTPTKALSKVPKREAPCHTTKKKLHPSPPQVAPVRKRSRTARPYSHHLKKLTQVVKVEDHHQSKLELFDFLDGDQEFLVRDDNQEVPSLLPAHDSSSSELDFLSPDCESQESDHSASAESFSSFFKSKAAAHSHAGPDDGDQFLVPGGLLVSPDSSTAASSDDDLPGDAFFLPGDIPGLGGFDSLDMSDDFSLSFDLALQNNSRVEAFEGDGGMITTCKVELDPFQPDQFTGGPFAKFFATKTKAELIMQPTSAERIASQAREILKCCRDDARQSVPSLQLNLNEVLAAWSDRSDLWIYSSEDSHSSGSSDAGVVPDMDAAPCDDIQSGAARDARVLRYKEKRRTRLFSKKIRYEVRKLNAERRPRMKGRFVKRTTTTTTTSS